MAMYTMVGGVHGVGKSSFLGAFANNPQDTVLTINDDVSRINYYIQKGVSFIRETTLAEDLDVQIARMAHEAGYQIRLCYLVLDTAEECLERIQNRVRHGYPDTPCDEVTIAFKNRWRDLKRILPYCAEVMVFDNNNGFDLVAEYHNGELCQTGDQPPVWLFK